MEYYIEQFGWFFELGLVTIIATILSILFTNLWKVTILKKSLLNANSISKDQILGHAGTITSLVLFGIVYIAEIMITQHTFSIDINWNDAWISIVSGASVTWVAAKGLYTAWHKFRNKIKAGSDIKNAANEAINDINKVKADVDKAKKSANDTSNFTRRR